MQKKHKKFNLFFLVFAIALASHSTLLWSAASTGYGYPAKYQGDFGHFDYVNPNAPQGGTLTLASLGTTYDTFNPFILKGDAADALEPFIFETLMVSSDDEPYSIYGLLADDIQLAEDGLSVTFHINPKARFSDGSPVTVEDVKFSFDTLKSKLAHPGYRIFWSDVKSATILPDAHVRFDFSKQNPELYMIISGLTVFPKSWVGDTPFDKLAIKHPIGSGPYRLKSYDFGKQLEYVKNPDYWAKDLSVRKGMFNFERVVYKYYKDRTISLEAFKAGEFDFISVYSSKKWANDYRGKRFDSGEIIKNTFKHQNNEAIQGFVFNTRNEKFKDKKVREALGLAFDFEWANRMLFYKQYQRAYSFFSNSDLAAQGKPSPEELELLIPYKEQLDPKVFDSVWVPPKTTVPSSLRKNLRRAQKLLKDAGWSYKDGALRNSKGEAFNFHLMLGSKAFERIAAAFARNLEKLGIKGKLYVFNRHGTAIRKTSLGVDMKSDR